MLTARAKIRQGIRTLLKRIIKSNDSGKGYLFQNTLTDNHIGIPTTTVERMREFPFVNVFFGDENCANSNIDSALQTGGNRQLWHNLLEITIDCWLIADDQDAARDAILADLQAVFGNDYTIDNTVFSCAYTNSSPFATEVQKPNCGVTVRFNVWYRIYQTNPNITG